MLQLNVAMKCFEGNVLTNLFRQNKVGPSVVYTSSPYTNYKHILLLKD